MIKKHLKIRIPFTINDLQELESGESFDWSFQLIIDGVESEDWVEVELVQEDDDEYDEQVAM